tara:strand:+ start:2452 stop:2775 length:324 start_codon:yes stop_codon:yes gene_type:complete
MEIIGLKNLCDPAYVYLVISVIGLIISSIQNFGNVNTYCLGSYSCDVTNTSIIFVIKVLYILFWTWLLNIICKGGAPTFAWLLVLFPFVLLFVVLGLMMITGKPVII